MCKVFKQRNVQYTMCSVQCALLSAFGERAGQGFRAGWRYVSVTVHGGGQWGHKIGEEYPRQEYPRSNIPKKLSSLKSSQKTENHLNIFGGDESHVQFLKNPKRSAFTSEIFIMFQKHVQKYLKSEVMCLSRP